MLLAPSSFRPLPAGVEISLARISPICRAGWQGRKARGHDRRSDGGGAGCLFFLGGGWFSERHAAQTELRAEVSPAVAMHLGMLPKTASPEHPAVYDLSNLINTGGPSLCQWPQGLSKGVVLIDPDSTRRQSHTWSARALVQMYCSALVQALEVPTIIEVIANQGHHSDCSQPRAHLNLCRTMPNSFRDPMGICICRM